MPVIIYKQKLKYKDIEENISISFDCRYSEEGSSNQRVINVKESLKNNNIVLID